jgi:hypothetical protein
MADTVMYNRSIGGRRVTGMRLPGAVIAGIITSLLLPRVTIGVPRSAPPP